MSTVALEIARSNDIFIKHNFNNHDGEVPVTKHFAQTGQAWKMAQALEQGVGQEKKKELSKVQRGLNNRKR